MSKITANYTSGDSHSSGHIVVVISREENFNGQLRIREHEKFWMVLNAAISVHHKHDTEIPTSLPVHRVLRVVIYKNI